MWPMATGPCSIISFTEYCFAVFAIWEIFRALSSSFVLKGALIFFFSQRDSLLFSSTPQLQLRDSGFPLLSPFHLTFCSWLIIALLQTSPIPKVTDIHARELPLTSTGHYSPLLLAHFEWKMTPFSRNTLQVMRGSKPPAGYINGFHFSVSLSRSYNIQSIFLCVCQ